MVLSPTGVAVAWLLLCWSLLLQLMVAKASTRASVSADRVLDLIIIITKSVIKVSTTVYAPPWLHGRRDSGAAPHLCAGGGGR